MLVARTVDEKYNSILKNTTKEMNAILSKWQGCKKLITYTDINSVFKSLFARYCRHEFNYQFWSRIVRHSSPTCTVIDGKLVGIYVSSISSSIEPFKKAIENFNFKDEKFNVADIIAMPNFEGVRPETIVNYHSLKQITFK